jgi:hypothetical protein
MNHMREFLDMNSRFMLKAIIWAEGGMNRLNYSIIMAAYGWRKTFLIFEN